MNLNCNFVSYKTLGVNSQWVLEARTIKLVVLIQSKSTRNYNWYGTTMKNIFLDEILSIFFGVSPLPLKRLIIYIGVKSTNAHCESVFLSISFDYELWFYILTLWKLIYWLNLNISYLGFINEIVNVLVLDLFTSEEAQPVRDWFPYLWLYFANFIDDTARFSFQHIVISYLIFILYIYDLDTYFLTLWIIKLLCSISSWEEGGFALRN